MTGALSAGVVNFTSNHAIAQEPTIQASVSSVDWMIDPTSYIAKIIRHPDGNKIELTNGLVRRVFCITPNVTTIALDNLMTGEAVLRTIKPEAAVTINDYELSVGGLYGLPVQNYFLPEWLDQMTANARDFRFVRVEEGKPVERFPWKRVPEWLTEELPSPRLVYR